jgi:hypothetical protein
MNAKLDPYLYLLPVLGQTFPHGVFCWGRTGEPLQNTGRIGAPYPGVGTRGSGKRSRKAVWASASL